MYTKVEDDMRMSCNEASERYPDSYILIQRDNRDMFDPVGAVLYVGDDFNELFSLQVNLPVPLGVVVEGTNRSCSLGGVVVGT